MKIFKSTLYKINIALIIINTLLIIIPYYALLFLMVLGACQVLLALIIGLFLNQLDKDGKIKWIIYMVLTSIVLSTMYLTGKQILKLDFAAVMICMFISIGLAFLNLNITYLFSKNES
ncbi:hypothetical protein [Winogradskyella sp. 3972H.M.0a.05]|uniref:hypothetical protein n=1 Tax=Winogradskyella sp. 3972H.M.0a.05 TaxID=2950277 RepID=UPI00339A9864